MSRYLRPTAIVALLLFIDGFDLFLLGKIAPGIAAGFGRPPGDMRLVFTWHQAGLAVGAFLMPALADRFGLRRMLTIMTFLVAVGTIASSFAPTLLSFAILRGFTGLSLAGLLPVALALLSDLVPAARLSTLLAITLVGMSAGIAANGIAAAWLLDAYGWQSGLWLGAVLPIIALPLVAFFLPEAARFSDGGLQRSARGSRGNPVIQVFSERRAPMTLLLWVLCFLTMGHTALVAAWLPTFFQELGGIEIQRFAVVSMLSVLGVVGTLAIGWLQDRSNPILLTAIALLGNGLGLIVLGMLGFGSAGFAAAFTIWSILQTASITGLNLLLVRAYPSNVRSTGQGWAAGFGRIGGIAAPAAGAMILTAHISLPSALWIVSLPMILIAAVVMPLLAWSMRGPAIESSKPAPVRA